ncbi:MAG: hypothetical protein F6K22_37370, partial [Okeania sp. SIO2F4]|uniref:hypothetical protein n=1 Tax=Okeania sp. SIO2F4 TaxID=2607790 RepID=UPI00142A9447
MHKILNYQLLEEIYASDRTVVYRGYAELYKKLVILKLPNHPYPNFHASFTVPDFSSVSSFHIRYSDNSLFHFRGSTSICSFSGSDPF